MQEKKWNMTKLSEKSGLFKSEVSRLLNQKQSLSFNNLESITRAFELAEDTFYSWYVNECFLENRYLDKRRSQQFLYKCASKEYERPLQQILDAILDERSKTILSKNLDNVFSVAESLFTDGKEKQSLRLYEIIIESMPNHFSQQVAISYFRKFYLVRGTEEEEHAITLVLKHLPYMPYEFQVLSYFWISSAYYFRQQWKKVLDYAKILEQTAKEGFYYAEAILFQAFALKQLGGTLNEIVELFDRSAQVSDYHADIAKGNFFETHIEFGNLEYLDQFLSWAEERDDFFVALPRILEGFVKLGRIEDAHQLLNRFQHIFEEIPTREDPYRLKMYLHFRYAIALYRCARNEIEEGLNELLDVANKAYEIGILERFKKCLQIYWEYKDHTSLEHEKKYMQLLNKP
jgi:transcriptional regulator with XRE-family HTH domain